MLVWYYDSMISVIVWYYDGMYGSMIAQIRERKRRHYHVLTSPLLIPLPWSALPYDGMHVLEGTPDYPTRGANVYPKHRLQVHTDLGKSYGRGGTMFSLRLITSREEL